MKYSFIVIQNKRTNIYLVLFKIVNNVKHCKNKKSSIEILPDVITKYLLRM